MRQYDTYEPSVNQAPVADILYVSTGMNKAISVTLTGIDPGSDFFTLLMKPLTYSVVTQPKNGTLTGTAPALESGIYRHGFFHLQSL